MKLGVRCEKCLKKIGSDEVPLATRLFGQDSERWRAAWDLLKSATGAEFVDAAARQAVEQTAQCRALADTLQVEIEELKGKLVGAENAMQALIMNHARSMAEPTYTITSNFSPEFTNSSTVTKHSVLRPVVNLKPWWAPVWLWSWMVDLVVSSTGAGI